MDLCTLGEYKWIDTSHAATVGFDNKCTLSEALASTILLLNMPEIAAFRENKMRNCLTGCHFDSEFFPLRILGVNAFRLAWVNQHAPTASGLSLL